MKLTADMTTGSAAVEVFDSLLPPEDLFGFAERRNPKRAFIFVSKVLGRYVPVCPLVMRQTYTDLAAQMPADLPGPVLVVGMAETAIGMGAGVHDALGRNDALYLPTTRHPLKDDMLAHFKEEHSHATHQLIHMPADPAHRDMLMNAQTLILVDDEATTGRTLYNLATALHAQDISPQNIICTFLTDWSAGKAAAAVARVFPQARVRSIALAKGSYSWTPSNNVATHSLPADIAERGSYDLATNMDWGRLGITKNVRMLNAKARPARRTLVLGTSEFVWQPFLLAEDLARQGEQVKFAAVGRSPIFKGLMITDLIRCRDNYGLGVPNYLYNVDPAAYDRIILCVETPPDSIDPVLIDALKPEVLSIHA
ncbi:phosphoribosyltransferase domain-containing protein [Yoonia sp. 2307UL14-13]|uniref:phosphoribosyltransferase domain-containing protein n=1 Tax=Yoonia sp. 2307UL14-13 TaxID=3126506 RepID=UPI0030B4BC3A